MRYIKFLESLDKDKTIGETIKYLKGKVEKEEQQKKTTIKNKITLLEDSFIVIGNDGLLGKEMKYIEIKEVDYGGKTTEYEDFFIIKGNQLNFCENHIVESYCVKNITLDEKLEFITQEVFESKRVKLNEIKEMINKEL